MLDRIKAGESVHATEYGRLIARIVPVAPMTGIPLLDQLIEEGRAIPAAISSAGISRRVPIRCQRAGRVTGSPLSHVRQLEALGFTVTLAQAA